MKIPLVSQQFVENKTNKQIALSQNTIGNAIRIGIRKDNCDKACVFIFGAHNSKPFAALIYVNWDKSGVHANVNKLIGECTIRYTEDSSEHAIVDITTNIYGVAFISCTNSMYASYLGIS